MTTNDSNDDRTEPEAEDPDSRMPEIRRLQTESLKKTKEIMLLLDTHRPRRIRKK